MSKKTDPKAKDPATGEDANILPVELELYIEPDGTVTFADLAAEVVPIAQELNPDQALACDVPGQGDSATQQPTESDSEND